jgi:argininosuccinate lyase
MSGAPKQWGGRFAQGADPTAEAFTASIGVDQRLWRHDILGSEAWARALGRAGLLAPEELTAILAGLGRVREEIEGGRFTWRRELEDVHTNVERRLIELAGPVGGKLHTGR